MISILELSLFVTGISLLGMWLESKFKRWWEFRRWQRGHREGFSLIELMVVMLVVEILFVMAAPNPVALMRYGQRKSALEQVQRVRTAANTQAVCTAQQLSCPGVASQIPIPGTLVMQGYVFAYSSTDGAWIYTAVPVQVPNRSFYVDGTGLIRFADSSMAGPDSPLLLQ